MRALPQIEGNSPHLSCNIFLPSPKVDIKLMEKFRQTPVGMGGIRARVCVVSSLRCMLREPVRSFPIRVRVRVRREPMPSFCFHWLAMCIHRLSWGRRPGGASVTWNLLSNNLLDFAHDPSHRLTGQPLACRRSLFQNAQGGRREACTQIRIGLLLLLGWLCCLQETIQDRGLLLLRHRRWTWS